MDNRLLYLKQSIFEAKAYTISGVSDILSQRSEINKLACKYLFSVESYKKSIRRVLPLKNKIPIYFSNKLFLFYLKTNDGVMYYINYFEILKICFDENIIIIFKNGDILKLGVSKKIVTNEIKKIKIILNYINNLV